MGQTSGSVTAALAGTVPDILLIVKCPYCVGEMLPGKVRLRGFALYPMAAWVNWEPDGARGRWQVLPSGLFPRPAGAR